MIKRDNSKEDSPEKKRKYGLEVRERLVKEMTSISRHRMVCAGVAKGMRKGK